ncbi:hypothetical protein F5877DRAFT_84119 [Lentinula edodes]|nr:hypothetical protein F5877DRAFT_84119 [Lentinula edodes]
MSASEELSDLSLPSILTQLTEQTLTSQQQPGSTPLLSWSPTTSFLVATLVFTLCVRRAWRFYCTGTLSGSSESTYHNDLHHDAYYHHHHDWHAPWPRVCITMRELCERAEEVDEVLGSFKTSMMMGTTRTSSAVVTGEVTRANFGYFDVMQQWEVMMEYEERMMRIQETILDLSLETHNLHDIHLHDPSTPQEKSVQLYPEQTPPTSESLPTLSIPMFIPTSTVPLSLPTFIPTSIPTPIRRLFLNCIYHLRRIRRIAECYCDLRRLRTEIHVSIFTSVLGIAAGRLVGRRMISEQMSRREQVRWGLQVSKLRRASMP